MIINSNDIFSQIGLAVDTKYKDNYVSKPKYIIYLEIQLSQDQKYVLEVKDNDNPYTVAYQFCQKHKLNKLAISIVQNKVREAMQIEQEKLKKKTSKQTSALKKQKSVNNLAKSNIKSNLNTKNSPIKSRHGNNLKYQHQQSKTPIKQISPSKSKSTKKLQKGTQDNIYLRSLIKSRMIQQHRNKLKVQMQKKQEQQLTFKPKINNVSQKIMQFLRTNQITKQKKPSPPKKVYQQMRQCTFKPQINSVSQRIINNKSLMRQERQKYNKIYKQQSAIGSKPKKNHEEEQFPFKPQINPKSAQRIVIPFFQRLQIAQQKRTKEASKQHFYDQQQCSFQPKIGRAPLKQRPKDSVNIWEYLHYGSKKNEDNDKSTKMSKVSKQLSASSQLYYENLIQQRISKVFEILDNNNDGQISPNQIAIQLLPIDCLHFLKPIFMEMDEVDATLNYYDFKRAVHALLSDSDPGAKGAFISTKWKKQLQQKQSFRPNINKKSKEMSVNRSVQNLYKQGLKQKKNKQYKLERERALRQEKELAECSFKPVLNHSSKIYIDKIARKKNENKINKSISDILKSFTKQNEHEPEKNENVIQNNSKNKENNADQ